MHNLTNTWTCKGRRGHILAFDNNLEFRHLKGPLAAGVVNETRWQELTRDNGQLDAPMLISCYLFGFFHQESPKALVACSGK